MNARKKFRSLMTGKRLVLMPGAYDGLSARIMEAEGFEAICAGGYAAIGSMLAQADMASRMRAIMPITTHACAARSKFRFMSMPIPDSAVSTMCGR